MVMGQVGYRCCSFGREPNVLYSVAVSISVIVKGLRDHIEGGLNTPQVSVVTTGGGDIGLSKIFEFKSGSMGMVGAFD